MRPLQRHRGTDATFDPKQSPCIRMRQLHRFTRREQHKQVHGKLSFGTKLHHFIAENKAYLA